VIVVVVVVVTVMVSWCIFVPEESILLLCLILTDVVYIGLLLLCFNVFIFLCVSIAEIVAELTTEIVVERGDGFGSNLFLKISNLFLKKDINFWMDIVLLSCMRECDIYAARYM
jgi:hypothetical protein